MRKCIFLVFFFFSCKTIEVSGLATNAKDGASIQTRDAVYVVEILDFWNDSINDKNIKVLAKVIREVNNSKPASYGEKSYKYKQERFGKTIIIKLKDIKILK